MATPLIRDAESGRFVASDLYVADESGCWLWTGIVGANGYGRARRGQRKISAHRVVYEQHMGPISDDLMLDHLCRVRHCVNPAHLEPVTNAENQRRGNAVRLDWDAVRFIRANCRPRHPEFSMRALGRRFGVTHEAIRKIINHTSWVEARAS